MDWRKLLGAKAPSIPDLEASLAALRAEKAAAEAEISTLADGRRAVLLEGTDDALRKHDDKAAAAVRNRDRAGAAAEEVASRLAAARTAAAEAERRARYDDAAMLAEAASAELRRVYPEAVTRLRALLRQLAEAEIAVAAANLDRPAGAAPISGPEGFRMGTGRPEKILRTEQVDLWADRTGRPQSAEMQPHVRAGADGFGYVPRDLGGTGGVRTGGLRRIAFTATTVQPADGFRWVDRLAATLALPPLGPGDQAAWTPIADRPQARPESVAAAVLAHLDELERAVPRGPKPVQVRHEVVDPRDLYWDPAAAQDGPAWAGAVGNAAVAL